MKTLEVGTEIYNHGDMANAPHFGTITAFKNDRWGCQYQITLEAEAEAEAEAEREPYWVRAAAFSEVYLGHGGTRFVSRAAYDAYRAEQIAELQESVNRRSAATRAGG